MNYSILEYTKIQFRGTWSRTLSPSGITIYTALDPKGSDLLVVGETEAGVLTTYEYMVPGKNEVWANLAENLVQIPGLCLKSAPGDATKCG